MAITARASFKTLKKRLEDSSRLGFQRVCYDLLAFAWPDLQYAPELRLHDRRGADVFSFGRSSSDVGDGWDYDFVVQCKGVEDKEFGRDDYQNALKDIAKFQRTKLRTKRYWLVLNRGATQQGIASTLDDAVASLVSAGVAGEALWLDPQALLVRLFEELIVQSKRRIRDRNAEQLARYNAAMRDREQYVGDVPFRLRLRRGAGARARWVEQVGRDPRDALVTQARQRSSGAQRFRIIVSEFGFGKTLLLLQLASKLGSLGRAVLYQPLVELPRDGFSNEFSLVRGIYDRLFPEDESTNRTADYPPLAAFREVLRFDAQAVLLLDGLDEYQGAYSFSGLCDVFRSLKDLACDVIVSVRKEFFDAYAGNFDEAMMGTGNDRQILLLEDWDEKCILEFLDGYGRSPGIDALKERVRTGQYETHYGDIPKRPLFLEMLADDVLEDPAATRDLASLYRHYLERKMGRDVRTPFDPGYGGGRPVPLPGIDILEFRARLIELQEALAAKSIEQLEGATEQVFRGELAESEVRLAAQGVGLGEAPLPALLQHSVLMPSGRTARASLILRFAHRSLQEFLAASWFARVEGVTALSKQPPLPAGVVRFLEQILRAAPRCQARREWRGARRWSAGVGCQPGCSAAGNQWGPPPPGARAAGARADFERGHVARVPR